MRHQEYIYIPLTDLHWHRRPGIHMYPASQSCDFIPSWVWDLPSMTKLVSILILIQVGSVSYIPFTHINKQLVGWRPRCKCWRRKELQPGQKRRYQTVKTSGHGGELFHRWVVSFHHLEVSKTLPISWPESFAHNHIRWKWYLKLLHCKLWSTSQRNQGLYNRFVG